MPFTSGSITASWYRAGRQCPPDARERFARPLARHSFRPIDSDKGEKQSIGWVDPRNILSSSLHWDQMSVGPYLFLMMRIDKKAVSPILLKAHIRQALRAAGKEKKGKPIPRTERKIIIEKVTADLLKQTSSSVAVHEAVWNTASGDVFFGSSSKGLSEGFCELFAATFDIELFPSFPLARTPEFASAVGHPEGANHLQPSYWGTAAPIQGVHDPDTIGEESD